MHLPTIPGPCTSAYLRHNVRVSNAFTHIFFIHILRLPQKHQHGCQTTHGSLPSICKYSHCSVLIADCVPHTGGPLHRYLNIFMCLLICARHHCPLRPPSFPRPRAVLTVIALCHLAKEQEFPWDPWQLMTDLERENFHVFSYSNPKIFKMENLEEQGRSIRLLGH